MIEHELATIITIFGKNGITQLSIFIESSPEVPINAELLRTILIRCARSESINQLSLRDVVELFDVV